LDSGVALFCAAGAKDEARLADRDTHTLFTWALLAALRAGDPAHPGPLTLRQVADVTVRILGRLGEDDVPRPELHVPNQAQSDLAQVRLFPNPAAPTDEAPARPPVLRTPDVVFERQLHKAMREMGRVSQFTITPSGPPPTAVRSAATVHGVAVGEILAVWQTRRRGVFRLPESLILTRTGVRAENPWGILDLNYETFPDCRFSADHLYSESFAPEGRFESHNYRLKVEHPSGTWQSRWLGDRSDVQNLVDLFDRIRRLKS
ncbi:hypothetical protein, partial [Kitasatospora sp. NPDC093558]|uniref:hypothetical protein n=1 Tax=Kitasatospora sp. NPDC093558 TaxID=3155201 RepID=UPI0034393E59